MTDDILTDLITSMVAARADGDGVLTIAAVRARLHEAKLRVDRVDELLSFQVAVAACHAPSRLIKKATAHPPPTEQHVP